MLGFCEQKVPIPRSPFNRGYLRRQEELEAQNSHASWPGLLPSFLDSKTPREVITRPRVPRGSRISRPRHLPDQATPDQSRSRSRCILVPVQCPVGSAEGPETIFGNYSESHPCAEFIEFPRKISELSCWDMKTKQQNQLGDMHFKIQNIEEKISQFGFSRIFVQCNQLKSREYR